MKKKIDGYKKKEKIFYGFQMDDIFRDWLLCYGMKKILLVQIVYLCLVFLSLNKKKKKFYKLICREKMLWRKVSREKV